MNNDNLTISRKWLLSQIDDCERMNYTAHSRNTLAAYQEVLRQEIKVPAPVIINMAYSDKAKSIMKQEENIEKVIVIVCNSFKISRQDLLTRKMGDRKSEVILPKHISYWLMRQITSLSFKKIGEIFNCQHANVLMSVRKIQGFVDMRVDERGKLAIQLLEQLEA
jgi:chromosomal replication initiation ATPase DnaA